MLSKGPHISIEAPSLVPRILKIDERDFNDWPESVRSATISLAEELFLAMYNPYIPASVVRASVNEQFENFRRGLAQDYATAINEGITMFWSAWEADEKFRNEVIRRLSNFLPDESIETSRHARVANATDATDLRLELPLLVVSPENADQVCSIIKLANEMQFALIPRGGGSGLTGGAVPARKRTVILSLNRMTKIGPIDQAEKTLTAQAGVITIDAYKAAKEAGLFFTVDPASKQASSIGGNVAENAGGPICFEYGTTIDNLLSYRMVTPLGEKIEVVRQNHPRRKIMPDDIAIFEVLDADKNLLRTIELPGTVIRKEGLGKDVTNKALGGLPGVQKEGTDGVIVDATFILHELNDFAKVIVLEFFGTSMHNCMLVINDIVEMRDEIRKDGDKVKITALEEFNIKYVRAIKYQKKSSSFEGDPISVIIIQLESNEEAPLEAAVNKITDICSHYDGVDSFVAKDEAEAEVFWEDRHNLPAIAKRTSGFKINEDVVIPLRSIPEYSKFLEELNVEYMARAYRWALKEAGNLKPLDEDQHIVEELAYATSIIKKEITSANISDEELELHAILTLRSLAEKQPELAKKLAFIEKRMLEACITVASHMHAGDGNWHVNIPVNSNDPIMLKNGDAVAQRVMAKAQELGGEVTGEHGIGITKIDFLTDEKLEDFIKYKEKADPFNIMNPAKLTQRKAPVAPFTFSFNHLIEDIRQSGLQDKEKLISLLAKIQICTRCGKCKHVCPMYLPEKSMLHFPRNKNLVLGALIEAIYYTQVNMGKPKAMLLVELKDMMEHCTGCGRCEAICPLDIGSSEVALSLRSYLAEEGATGHPIKNKALEFVAKDPAKRIPMAGKLASLGQKVQNLTLAKAPKKLRMQFSNPIFAGPGPKPRYRNLQEMLHLDKGSLFVPKNGAKATVLYFPGCGGAVFYRNISIAGISLLLKKGFAVLLPAEHLCCGYPLLAAGLQDSFAINQDKNIQHLKSLADKAEKLGFPVSTVLTACGSCRDGINRHFISEVITRNNNGSVQVDDLSNFVFNDSKGMERPKNNKKILYQAPCHTEIPGARETVSAKLYAEELSKFSGSEVMLSPGCCSESGMGAMTSPKIYNELRQRKSNQMDREIEKIGEDFQMLVNCPSCKMGIMRIFMNSGRKQEVLHVLEYLAEQAFGELWQKQSQKLLSKSHKDGDIRKVDIDNLALVQLSPSEEAEED